MNIPAKSRGQATVEMALVLPIFIFVIVGIFDFGRTMHSWSTLNYQCLKAARAATKRISPLIARNLYTPETHLQLGVEGEENVYSVRSEFWRYRSPVMPVENYENLSFTGVGTDTKNVTISASYKVSLMTPFMGSLVGGSNKDGTITISASVTVEKE
ncbi:MAG: hypothetical protein CVV42_06950 [Candidatus Riflebacteria bacterium HGW-Riflebacteria-2]|jgi:hypothetical protein|nr:MAG: hypothetical protein CVV42_06950 [Candidatus Riflebacteria bacterium HGW-Riflebacteria-2]